MPPGTHTPYPLLSASGNNNGSIAPRTAIRPSDRREYLVVQLALPVLFLGLYRALRNRCLSRRFQLAGRFESLGERRSGRIVVGGPTLLLALFLVVFDDDVDAVLDLLRMKMDAVRYRRSAAARKLGQEGWLPSTLVRFT